MTDRLEGNKLKWTPIEEELPAEAGKRYGVQVLAVMQYHYSTGHSTRSVISCVFKNGSFRLNTVSEPLGEKQYQKVTHWMYMPELPNKYKKQTKNHE